MIKMMKTMVAMLATMIVTTMITRWEVGVTNITFVIISIIIIIIIIIIIGIVIILITEVLNKQLRVKISDNNDDSVIIFKFIKTKSQILVSPLNTKNVCKNFVAYN